MSESERVRTVYERRGALWQEERFRSWMPGNLFIHQERERILLELLRRHGFLPLGDRRVLDVGCGPGKVLLDFMVYGVQPENLFGVDLLEKEISLARTLAPHLDFRVADARNLPFEDASFDLVLSFTTFSAIEDHGIRKAIADEMRRVLRPDGAVLWYDFWLNPVNPDAHPIRMQEIRRLFGEDSRIDARRVTLAPPIARRVAAVSWLACGVLAKVPLLRTHWLALIRPG